MKNSYYRTSFYSRSNNNCRHSNWNSYHQTQKKSVVDTVSPAPSVVLSLFPSISVASLVVEAVVCISAATTDTEYTYL